MTHTIICPTLTMIEKNGFFRARALRARTDYVAPLRKADLRSAYVASLRKAELRSALKIVRWCEATIRGIMPEHL